MSQGQQSPQFGKKSPNSIVISSNGKVREYKIHAGLFLAIGSIFTMFMVGYVGATAYLAFREDLVAASYIKQTRMKHEYEDRIAALRSKVDRITSRQLLDQQAVEAKVSALMQQQEALSGRSGALQGLLDRASAAGLAPKKVPVPVPNPQKAEIQLLDTIKTGSVTGNSESDFADASSFLRGSATGNVAVGSSPSEMINTANGMMQTATVFSNVLEQINQVERIQREQVLALHSAAYEKTNKLASVFDALKIQLPSEIASDIGGPYVPDGDLDFEDLTEELVISLDRLDVLKAKVTKLPVGNPLPGASISSSFGNRVDPFHRSSAFHSGIDFRAATGTPVVSTGAGTVIKAGRNGGYGLMVEIDHGHGITTRYAHLSKISVKQGEKIKNSQRIGRVGSTGRSTGPHLHYEVRRSQKASNPSRFLKIGNELKQLL
ncbi:MAG: M23 family metallopeptidase [Salaquimonas sp.]